MARLTVKQHGFEIGFVAAAGIVIAVASVVVAVRLNAVGLSADCIARWQEGGPVAAPDCAAAVDAFSSIVERESGPIFTAIAILPFVGGLILGVPLIARELELGTAQTAWWLEPARPRWLQRRAIVPAIVLLSALTLAIAAGGVLQATREAWAPAGPGSVTQFGWPVVVRGFAVLAVGIALGVTTGRALPALILGAVLCVAIATASTSVRDQWLFEQRQPVIDNPDWQGISYGVAFLARDGTVFDEGQAVSLAPPGADNPYDWLAENGFREVEVGTSNDVATGWLPYDLGLSVAVGVAAVVVVLAVLPRRRPA